MEGSERECAVCGGVNGGPGYRGAFHRVGKLVASAIQYGASKTYFCLCFTKSKSNQTKKNRSSVLTTNSSFKIYTEALRLNI
jgi:hypothetical protein